jgi:hypothetical protein
MYIYLGLKIDHTVIITNRERGVAMEKNEIKIKIKIFCMYSSFGWICN